MSRHSRPTGRHRARRPPSNKTPAVIASAVVGATAAALSTAAASAEGLGAIAANATSLQAPVADSQLGVGGEEPLPAQVVAEEPLSGRVALSTAEAQSRYAGIQAARAAKRRQVALIEARRPKWQLPMRTGTFTVTSCYEPRWGTFHYGVDMAAPYGTAFYAAGDGVVIRAGTASGFGNVIMIEHSDGTITVYGHEEKLFVEEGERVKAGQLIGLVGAEGESTGPHLHFEIRHNSETGDKSNPIDWLRERGVNLDGCG